jgi:hypothetical protein
VAVECELVKHRDGEENVFESHREPHIHLGTRYGTKVTDQILFCQPLALVRLPTNSSFYAGPGQTNRSPSHDPPTRIVPEGFQAIQDKSVLSP